MVDLSQTPGHKWSLVLLIWGIWVGPFLSLNTASGISLDQGPWNERNKAESKKPFKVRHGKVRMTGLGSRFESHRAERQLTKGRMEDAKSNVCLVWANPGSRR